MTPAGRLKTWEILGERDLTAVARRMYVTIRGRTLRWILHAGDESVLAELAPGRLPPLPVGLIERAEQRAALRAALEQERSIVVIQGLGGTGKTSMALDVAHQV